jgi:hypothetical protein
MNQPRNLAASVRQRLLNLAQIQKVERSIGIQKTFKSSSTHNILFALGS